MSLAALAADLSSLEYLSLKLRFYHVFAMDDERWRICSQREETELESLQF